MSYMSQFGIKVNNLFPLIPIRLAAGEELRLNIVLLRVILNHPPGVELWHQCHHRSADLLNPLTRQPVRVAGIKARNDFLRQNAIKILAVALILKLNGVRMGIVADGEAVGSVVAFAPPAIEDAEIQTAVAAGFLPAGAGCLEWPAWVVQPYITTRNHLASHVHVVVLDEHQVPFQLGEFT